MECLEKSRLSCYDPKLLITEIMTKSIDLSIYNEVFCDSLEALEWAYKNGLSKSSTIKTSSPAVLWDKKINTHNIESRWSIKELEKFQGGIQGLTKDIFDAILSINGVDREIALAISKSVYRFQRIIYKAACLDESDFTDRRLFIYVDGKTGPSGNMMNSPWDKFLSNNPFFKMERYTLCNDKWSFLTTQNVPGWRRFEVAGFETIVYRLAEKFMDKLPDWMFTKEILMPNENELNIEIAASLALRGVKIVKVKLKGSHSIENIDLHTNIALIYKEILPIIIRRIEQWVTPSAVEVTISLFKSYLENQLKQFELMSNEWGKVIVKNDKVKRIVLLNAPGKISGQAISYVCNKNNIPVMSSPHGVTVEISKVHNNVMQVLFANSVTKVMFSNNHKTASIANNTYFNNAKHYVVGAPSRLIRGRFQQRIDKSSPQIVYVSTNLYHMGYYISTTTDYGNAKAEQKIITDVLSKLPHKVCYKTYPEDNRRYADPDPVLNSVKSADNIELFSDKVDMRYLIHKYRVFVTTCATSTLGWVVMSGKPVIFIDQKNNSPLTNDAHISMSKGIFVFDDDGYNFHKNLRDFISQPISEIERLWKEKENNRKKMIRDYFSAYKGGAGKRASEIILKEYLS